MMRRVLVMAVVAAMISGFVAVLALERQREIAARQMDQQEIMRLRMLNDLLRQEGGILRDQLREYESLEFRRSQYEAGLTAGLLRRREEGYVEGYHAATQQMEEARKYDETFEKVKVDVGRRIGVTEKK